MHENAVDSPNARALKAIALGPVSVTGNRLSGRGRSEFIPRAHRQYLELERRREIDAADARGYGEAADEVWDEFRDLVRSQEWPEP